VASEIFMSDLFDRASFVLVSPSHPGNLGASARALATMGFARLVVAESSLLTMHLDEQAVAMAAGASHVLDYVQYQGLENALAPTRWSLALTARPREFEPPRLGLEQAMEEAVDALLASPNESIAIVFGAERSGLSNEQLMRCSRVCGLDVSERFGSLNLAQAVQLVSYALRRAIRARGHLVPSLAQVSGPGRATAVPATHAAVEGLHDHLMRLAHRAGTLDPANPGRMDERLRRLFARAGLLEDEVQMLRGLCSDLEKNL